MTAANSCIPTSFKSAARRVILAGVLGLGTMSISHVAVAQTANGEIQGRPAPVFRCPGLPCAVPNVFNISVAVQYNAPAADITAIQNMISAMSAVLFDVTDGQAEIGEAFIFNNAFGTAADVRIYPSTSPTWWQANTGQYKVGGSIHVSIDNVLAAGFPGESLAHEFVHLVFDARDEYESRAAGCGGLIGGATCPAAAAIAAGETRCLMDGGGNGMSSELCWGHGNPANLTDISGGNHDATLVTEHSRCRSNRSCWEQVVWSWPDHFTMPAGAPNPGTGGGVVDPTSFVVVNSTVRVVLVLDESGSMSLESPTRMERLKVAANDFIALAPNGTEIGIVSFSTDAEAASGHANVAIAALNAGHRATCNAAIAGLTPNGWTGIGLGLQKARTMIMTAGGVTASTYIVLMTDGVNNRPLPDYVGHLNGVLATLLADGIPVLVTCTGGDLGLASQCAEIAAGTGGFSVDSANSADLQQAFVDFHEKIFGRQAVDSVSARVPNQKKVYVEQGSESVTFTVTWPEANGFSSLTVIDPANVSHPSTAIPQGRFTRLSNPMPGDYTMVMDPTQNTFYTARGYVRHQINSLTAGLRYPTVLPGKPMFIYAYPRSAGGSITSPTEDIVGTVLLPNGQTDTIKLSDRGPGPNMDGDDMAEDGVFTGVYLNTAMKGRYRFLLRADMSNWVTTVEIPGPRERAPRFVREVRISGAVGEPSDIVGTRISINEWMSSNTRTIRNPLTDQFDPWFELYNPNTVAVDLSGWSIANSLTSAKPYVVPQGYTIPAGAFVVVWADGLDRTNAPELHVNFKLSNNGDNIALFAEDGRLVENVSFGAQVNDVSQGRYPDGMPYIFAFQTPTPGRPNSRMTVPPLLARAKLLPNLITITFNTMPGATYRVDYKTSLMSPTWNELAPARLATGSEMSVSDPIDRRHQRFYRVVIVR